LSNELKKVIDPFNSPTEVTYDELGRTKTVTGTWNGTNYTYVNNVSYRAWGAVKSVSSGSPISYNSRMQPTHYGAYDYTYYDDGKLKEFRDVNDQVGNPQYVQFHYMS
jgi:YD repeat-containing protein